MKDRQLNYKKLTGKGRRNASLIVPTGTSCSLWLGDDHLLSVENTGFIEKYRRFFYRDIQSICLHRSLRGRILAIVYGSLLALTLLLTFLAAGDIAWQTLWIILDVVFLVPLGINLVLGPTCICFIRTSVQTEQLPSMSRLRLARKALAKLTPRIEEAQASLPSLAERRDDPEVIAALTAPDPPAEIQSRKSRTKWGPGYVFHWGLFSALIAQGIGAYFIFTRESALAAAFTLAALVLASMSGVAAIVTQRRREEHGLLPLLSIAATAGCFVLLAVTYGLYTASLVALANPEGSFGENFMAGQNVAKQVGRFLTAWTDMSTPFLYEAMVGLMVGSVLMGGLGVLLLLRHRRSPGQARAMPPGIPPATPSAAAHAQASPPPSPPPTESASSSEEL
ncbi:MAG: hypothetical protein HN742_23145 [Lentisphaerae bacterium]|nr:hypothetical protein [Lentisphaerota bacterium]MBT5605350.1 hypothetical protein [Lentisphaerota bacterium]MBT7060355.1 hypothetical protein [Lentisphaerota bacterium]MBT7844791.1 hypothetical protein [Lentisphaerota bacterium]